MCPVGLDQGEHLVKARKSWTGLSKPALGFRQQMVCFGKILSMSDVSKEKSSGGRGAVLFFPIT